jgi:DNA-binding CsgD family transcriptional regulator
MQVKHPCLTHNNVLSDICKPLAGLGVNFFGYTALEQSGNAFCLGSKKDYAEAYLAHHHVKSDVHYRPTFKTRRYHYHFWDFVHLDNEAAELYSMAAEFDQSHTLTVMRFDEEMTHCFHFSGSLHDVGINQRYLEKMDAVHSFIDYFDHCLQNVPEVAAIYDFPTHLMNPVKEKSFTIVESDPRLLLLDNAAQQELRFKNANKYYLTDGERQCLSWLRKGKSADMIAIILGVSRKTIERHISSIKQKYQCTTMYQLGEKINASGISEWL